MAGRMREMQSALFALNNLWHANERDLWSVCGYEADDPNDNNVPDSIARSMMLYMDRLRSAVDRVTIEIDGSTDPDIRAQPLDIDRLSEFTLLADESTPGRWRILGEPEEDSDYIEPEERLDIFVYRIVRGHLCEPITVEGHDKDELWTDAQVIVRSRDVIKALATEIWRMRALDELKSRTSNLPEPEPEPTTPTAARKSARVRRS